MRMSLSCFEVKEKLKWVSRVKKKEKIGNKEEKLYLELKTTDLKISFFFF